MYWNEFTLRAHLRFVSRCQHVKTFPFISTPNDSLDTSYSSVTALRRVGNGNWRNFSVIFAGLHKYIQLILIKTITKYILSIYTYAGTFRSIGLIPVAFCICCCCCCSNFDFVFIFEQGDVSALFLYFRKNSKSPIYTGDYFLEMTRLFWK
jgi:hypothetical protein